MGKRKAEALIVAGEKMKIGIVGLGPVGMSVLGCAISRGNDVEVIDINPSAYRKAKYYVSDAEWATYAKHRNRFKIHSAYCAMDFDSLDALMVCVNTGAVVKAAMMIKPFLETLTDKTLLVILESSVTPGIAKLFIRKLSMVGVEIVVSPERVMEGKLLRNLFKLPKYIGCNSLEGYNMAAELYREIGNDAKLFRCTVEEACIAKLSENAVRYLNIRFANMISDVCAKAGNCDFDTVRMLVNSLPDRNVLSGGIGIGGVCLEQDALQLYNGYGKLAATLGCAVVDENARQERIKKFLLKNILLVTSKKLSDTRVLFMGAAYRPNGFGIANSKALDIIDQLKPRFSSVIIFDSNVSTNERDDIKTFGFTGFAKQVDVIVLMVPHDELVNQVSAIFAELKDSKPLPAIINLTSLNLMPPSGYAYVSRRF